MFPLRYAVLTLIGKTVCAHILQVNCCLSLCQDLWTCYITLGVSGQPPDWTLSCFLDFQKSPLESTPQGLPPVTSLGTAWTTVTCCSPCCKMCTMQVGGACTWRWVVHSHADGWGMCTQMGGHSHADGWGMCTQMGGACALRWVGHVHSDGWGMCTQMGGACGLRWERHTHTCAHTYRQVPISCKEGLKRVVLLTFETPMCLCMQDIQSSWVSSSYLL